MVNNNSADQFEKAGAQAAEVFGRFVNIAAGLSREFGDAKQSGRHGANEPGNTSSGSDSSHTNYSKDSDAVLHEVGEQLRELREAANYTLDGFANALSSILDGEVQSTNVARTIDAVESGREAPPGEWAQAFSSLLGSNDVAKLFDQLSGNSSADSSANEPMMTDRAKKLSEIFATDSQLEDLSEEEFKKLSAFLSASYQQAKLMITK